MFVAKDIGEAVPMLAHRDASHALAIDLLGGARLPVASDPELAMWPHRLRLLAAIIISPAATLTRKAGSCLGCIPR